VELQKLILDLKAAKQEHGAGSIKVAECLDAMTSLFLSREDGYQAVETASEAHRIYEAHYGRQSGDTADSLLSLGDAYEAAGDALFAFEAYQNARWIFSRTEGELSQPVAIALLRMGTAMRQIGEIDEAIEMLQSSLKTFRLIGQSQSAGAAEVLKVLALIYHTETECEDPRRAIGHYLQCLNIHKLLHIDDEPHRDLGLIHLNVACILTQRGDLDAALDHFTQAEKIFVRGAFVRVDLVRLYRSLSALHEAAGRPAVAVETLAKALPILLEIENEAAESAAVRIAAAASRTDRPRAVPRACPEIIPRVYGDGDDDDDDDDYDDFDEKEEDFHQMSRELIGMIEGMKQKYSI